jgi:zinc transport system permease protein
MTVHEDIARLSGICTQLLDACLLCAIALTIAVGVKAVGALLTPALLIFPAVAVRPFSKTPEQMVALAFVFSVFTAGLGLWGSFTLDTPTGPTIVLSYLSMFGLGRLFLRASI